MTSSNLLNCPASNTNVVTMCEINVADQQLNKVR